MPPKSSLLAIKRKRLEHRPTTIADLGRDYPPKENDGDGDDDNDDVGGGDGDGSDDERDDGGDNVKRSGNVCGDNGGYFYVASCPVLRRLNLLKLGKTRNLMSRLNDYNCSRIENEFMRIDYAVRIVGNVDVFEIKVKRLLTPFVYRGEIVKCSVDFVKHVVECLL